MISVAIAYANGLCSYSRTIKPFSPWSDADDSLESMSDPEEDECDMPHDKESGMVAEAEVNGGAEGEADGVVSDVVVAEGDGDGETREDEEEDSSDDFFDAGQGAVIGPDHLSCAASESGLGRQHRRQFRWSRNAQRSRRPHHHHRT